MILTTVESARLYLTRPLRGKLARTRLLGLLLIFTLAFQSIVPASLYAKPISKRPKTDSKSTPLTAPPQSDTFTIYGPRQIERTGPVTRFTDQFTIPVDAIAPFTVLVSNGAPDGSGRVSMATVRLNGVVLVDSSQINLGVPSLTLPAPIVANNSIEVSFFGRFGARLMVSIIATRGTAGTQPVINDFNPKQGAPGTVVTLSGTSLKANNNDPLVTFAGSNNTRVPAQVISSTATEVRSTVPNGALTGFIELTTSGGLARTATAFTVQASQDFQVLGSPATVSAMQRGTAVQIVALTSQQPSFSQLAKLSVSGLPPGVTVTFEPQQITAGANSTLSIRLANVNLSPGAFSFSINAIASIDGHDVLHSFSSTLNVIAAGQTALTGRVLNNEKEPIFGATVSLDGRTATTDSAGGFLLIGVTAGQERPVMVDGRTASAPNKTYPVIVEPANVVAAQVNTVPFSFYLPAVDTQFEKDVVPNQNTVVDNPRLPDLALTIPANANLRNRDGTPVTRVSISPVAPDRVPAPLPSNLATNMVYTAQPGGAVTMNNVMMPVVYPNLAGANPNTRITLYYFDHDAVIWRTYGFGRVSQDGLRIEPEIDPNTGKPYGLPNFSWHFPNIGPGGNPGSPDECGCKNDVKKGSSNRGPYPVDFSTGVKIEDTTDLSFGGARGSLVLTRTYTSDLAQSCDLCPFGRGTTHNYDIKLTGNFTANNAGRVKMPEQVTGRLFSYNAARSAALGLATFTTRATTRQLADEVRKLSNGNLEYHLADGSSMLFNSSGRLISMTDTNSNTVTLSYSGNNLTSVTDAVGRALTFGYDSSGRIITATDPLGRIWRYTYEGTPGVAGQPGLTTVTDPLNNVTRYTYVTGGRLARIDDSRGNAAKRITYDSAGRVSQQQFADNSFERYDYTLSGTLITGITITDSLGRVETKRFNIGGYVTDYTDALGQQTHIERDMSTNLPRSISGPCGCTEALYEYDERGNLTKSTDRIGGVRRMEYEPVFNKTTRMIDELGRITTYAYDSRGNMISMTDALGRTTSYTYDGVGQLTGITDPLGHVKQLTYDAQGNITSVKDVLNNTTTLEYDAVGRLRAVVDPLGRRATFVYDTLDRITSVTDPANATSTLSYDGNGNLIAFINALNQRWTNVYDSRNRLASRTDTLGRRWRWQYNADDELTAITSPSGRRTGYAYDARGQVTSITSPLGFVVRYAYDNTRNLTSLTDERGNVTTFSYDELYRLAEQRDPLGQVTKYGYDAASNLTSKLDRLGRNTSYTYDALDRAIQIQYVDATVNYQYDPAYRLTRIDDTQSGSIVWNYDDADRLLAETTPQGVVAYTYNAASQRASMTAADRPPVNYTYDTAGRLKTITQTAETFTYGYDTLSRVASLQRPNGVRTDYAYDNVYRLSRLTHTNSGNQALEDFRYTYNAEDEIESITSLASASLLPTAKTATPANAANRIAQFGPSSNSYDNEGQSLTHSISITVSHFIWDARARLTRVSLSNGQHIDYGYDALDRRISRSISGNTTSFLYDDIDIVLDRVGVGGIVAYLNGVLTDDKLRQSSSVVGNSYFLQDHLASTLALSDGTGGVVERLSYEPYGGGASSALTRYTYTGRESDAEAGLFYYRARWFDPLSGRFLSEDPLKLENEDLNLYRYAASDPVSFADPFGLYRFGGTAHGPFGPELEKAMKCFDRCSGRDTVITSGRDSHPSNDPHSKGNGCDVGRNANPDLTRPTTEKCTKECFPKTSYFQEEWNPPKVGGTHFHFQTTPGRNGSTGFRPGIAPHGRAGPKISKK